LTAAELALIDTDFLTIGNSSAGAMTINAPVAFLTLDQLTLISGAGIIQGAGAPILLQKTLPITGRRVGTLAAFGGTGTVDLRAANEVPGSPSSPFVDTITGSAGSGRNFFFNNVLPMKLQDIGASAFSGGKVLVNSGLFGPLPPPPVFFFLEGGGPNLDAQLIASINDLLEINDKFKDEEEKKNAEKEKKKMRECGR
jgi:hypothetical protein